MLLKEKCLPRQDQKPPWRLGRFNYWNFSGIAPQESDEVHTFSPTWVREHSHRLSKEQFSAHVAGRRCEVAGCRLDDKLTRIRDQQRRTLLALRRYVQTDRLWQQDRTAQAVLRKLQASERPQIEALERAIRRKIKQRDWFPLLKDIARDQKVFQGIITGRLSSQHLTAIGRRYDLTEAVVMKIYRPYSRQRQYLLGNITSHTVRKVLATKHMSLAPLSRPIIPRKTGVEDDKPRPMFDKRGKLIDYDDCGEDLHKDTRDQMVFHWFAHALRNLSRYLDGNPPLPWRESCAAGCLRARDGLLPKGLRALAST